MHPAKCVSDPIFFPWFVVDLEIVSEQFGCPLILFWCLYDLKQWMFKVALICVDIELPP
jgi:hypothetical protein